MLVKKRYSVIAAVSLAVLLGLGGIMQAFGDDDGDEDEEHEGRGRSGEMHEGRSVMAPTNATFQTECSACHMAYPPSMLPAESWKAMMSTLDKHFDTDATLDKAAYDEILPYLVQNASQRKAETKRGEPVLRITDTAWFKRQHDEISATTWKRASIKSASNCMACHTQADKGNFDEDAVHIPR